MTPASSIPLSSTLRVLSQNVHGLQTKITMRKRKQTRIVALGSLLRSLEVDFFAIQEPRCGNLTGFKPNNACMSETCVLTQELFITRAASCRGVQQHTGVTSTAAELRHKPRVLSRKSSRA